MNLHLAGVSLDSVTLPQMMQMIAADFVGSALAAVGFAGSVLAAVAAVDSVDSVDSALAVVDSAVERFEPDSEPAAVVF